MARLRKSEEEPWIRPDSKTQVTAAHKLVNGAVVPIRVHTVVISVQHADYITNEDMRQILMQKVYRSKLSVANFCNYLGCTKMYSSTSNGRGYSLSYPTFW